VSTATPLLTQWGEVLTPAAAWPEYPRPLCVRAAWQNLNGLWQYAVRARRAAMPTAWDGEILVPFCIESVLSGVSRRVGNGERLWYRRTFVAASIDARTLLHFGAVDQRVALWVNAAYVGSHDGGFDPFTVDISEYLHAGDNELIVCVDDDTNDSERPRGKQHAKPQGIWYTPVTGIWQTVWLETVPRENHIDEVRITPELEAAMVRVEVLLARPTRDPTLAVRLTVRLGDRVVARTIARPDRMVEIALDAPQAWSPAQPTLYDVEAELVRIVDPFPTEPPTADGVAVRRAVPLRGRRGALLYAAATLTGAVLDCVHSYFAMRSVRVGVHPATGQPTLLLNGEPVFHLATLDQGWWPDGLYTPPADAALVYEIGYLKAAGFNAVRKHAKIEPARYYYHCDRLGLLVWQDMPSGFLPAQFVAPNDEAEGLRSIAGSEVHELTLARMVRRLRQHPSIVVWVLHNEGWGQFDSARLTHYIRGIDPSRPVDAVSGWLDVGAGDLLDVHDYAAAPGAPAGDGRRALVIGECGGLGWPVEGHLWDPAMRNWGYQTLRSRAELQAAYARLVAALVVARDAGVCAAVYTQTSDVEGEVNGLLTYDRRVEKLPRNWLADIHRLLST